MSFGLFESVFTMAVLAQVSVEQDVPPAPATGAPPVTSNTADAPTSEPAPSAEPEYAVEHGRVMAIWGHQRLPLPISDVSALHRDGKLLYAARGRHGVAIYDVSDPRAPRLVRELGTSGNAVGLHVAEGELWVVLVTKSALPLRNLEEQPASQVASAGLAAKDRPTIAPRRNPSDIGISRVTPGGLELDLGSRDGVRPGDRFAILRLTESASDAGASFVGEELITVATVVAVREDSALCEVERAAEVRLTDRARVARPEQTASLLMPPHLANVGEISLVLRPLINAGKPLGAGVLGEAEATYWGDAYFASLRVQPLGLGSTDDGSIVSTTALFQGGYEGQSFAVGLGVGVSWINGDVDYMLDSSFGVRGEASDGGTPPVRTEHQETHAAFTLAQVARLGARDGLHLSIQNQLIYHEESAEDDGDTESQAGFIYGGTSARLALPVSRRSDLFLEGGGGVMGYWFAGAGIATWLSGNGVPGSWRLSVSAGGAGIWGSREVTETYLDASGVPIPYTRTETIGVHGPMVAAGLAHRFSF